MQCTTLQQQAVEAWADGNNVRVTAVPGAGKSAVLLAACLRVRGKCLILAYNRELCRETKLRIHELGLEDQIECMTFHGLATFCVAPAPDDIALHDIIDMLDEGRVTAHKLTNISHILIDEAQDFRPSFLKLMQHLILQDEQTQFMVVGDANQMLYDYHEDDAASLEYLERPWDFFCSARSWKSIVLDETHRLTPEMARFVSAVFETKIQSARPESASPRPVEVHTVNAWSTGSLLARLLQNERPEDCCILVARRKNNVPLRSTLNYLSKNGFAIHVHGMDGQDPRVRSNKLLVSTWHAAKGTQRQVCVVLGFDDDLESPNPGYVALTRSQRRLVVVLDPNQASKRVVDALKRTTEADVVMDARTREMLTEVHLKSSSYKANRDVVCLDEWRPSGSGRWLTAQIRVANCKPAATVDEDDIVLGLSGALEDSSHVYKLACLSQVEHEVTGVVRRWKDIATPTRLARCDHKEKIDAGSNARFVPVNVPANVLLDTKTMEEFTRTAASCNPLSVDEKCFMACATLAWNGYHHTLRQLTPLTWMRGDRLERGVEVIRACLQDATEVVFDARVRVALSREQTVHVRADILSAERVYEFVWAPEICRSVHIDAAIKAAIHSSGICRCVNLKTGEVQEVFVTDRYAILTTVTKPFAPEGTRHSASTETTSGERFCLKRKACNDDESEHGNREKKCEK